MRLWSFPVECAGVAQLVRASACHAEGRGFKSRHSRHFYGALPFTRLLTFSLNDVILTIPGKGVFAFARQFARIVSV